MLSVNGTATRWSLADSAKKLIAIAALAAPLALAVLQPAAAQGLPKNPGSRSTVEDNGSLLDAISYGPILHGPYHLASTIGDGPHGSAGSGSGDYDFYRIIGLNRGWILSVDISAMDLGSELDPIVVIYDSAGTIIASNDDFPLSGTTHDSFVEVTLPADGDYFVDVHSFFFDDLDVLADPFDSSTGPGVGTEGDYELTIAVHAIHP